MHPGMFYWWKAARHAAGAAGCGSRLSGEPQEEHAGSGYDDVGGGAFGVRRPLRYMAQRLKLDDKQVAALAQLLSELKTERAQAAVDDRRTTAGFADALAAEAFDEKKASEAAELRVLSAQRLRDAVLRTLSRTHALLTPEQREQLAYLIRTGTLTI